MASSPVLILASASPRRADLLARVGISFIRRPVAVAEDVLPGERGPDAALRLARAKARSARDDADPEDAPLLACDTLVCCGGAVFGKPSDRTEARAMLRALSGRWHEVVTGIVLARPTGEIAADSVVTRVRFARLEPWEIDRYVDGGEPLGKAGAYAIQGAGAWFVERVEGSVTNVIGLPVERLRAMLLTAGHPGPSLRGPGGPGQSPASERNFS
ncbi:MAG: septum formation protein Maf [Acidobacteria bacterium]|nr:MAG: septum formation protein Maf [Acidobacteriota bacterium]